MGACRPRGCAQVSAKDLGRGVLTSFFIPLLESIILEGNLRMATAKDLKDQRNADTQVRRA